MNRTIPVLAIFSAVLVGGLVASAGEPATPPASWDARLAAAYLDGRQAWWMTWSNAARDHDTQCVSCHTALPYALARPVLRAVILATRDASTGTLSDDARLAFDNLWPLQFKGGEMAGGWAWLNFHNEPWEAPGSQYFCNSLAAIAIGTAPGGYAAAPAIQERVKTLATYLRGGAEKEDLLNRAMILWAATTIPGVLTPELRQRIADDLIGKQQSDGGWATASLVGDWKRHDSTPLDTKTDGYATGLVTYVLQQAGRSPADPSVARGLTWLVRHQDRTTGTWTATSVNKERDPASDVGKFMSDAATAYAVLALTRP